MKHCCESMEYWAEHKCDVHPDRFECPDALVDFSEAAKTYGLIVHDGGSSSIEISFCPWCGASLTRQGTTSGVADTLFAVPRRSRELQLEWAEELADRAGVPIQAFLAEPSAHMNFPIEAVRVELMDGSAVEFKYAFALVSAPRKAIAVFTEHCGHHVYPYHEARVFQAGTLAWRSEA